MAKAGRNPLPPEEKKDKMLTFAVTRAKFDELKQVSIKEKKSSSDILRDGLDVRLAASKLNEVSV